MTMEQRLEVVERELVRAKKRNRRLVAVMMSLSLGVWLLSGYMPPNQAEAQARGQVVDEIRARRLYLIDKNGKARIYMGEFQDQDGWGLLMNDENDNVRASMTLSDNEGGEGQPALRLFDEKGEDRAGMTMFMGDPELNLRDKNGQPSFAVVVLEEGPGLRMFDAEGKPRFGVTVANDGPVLNMSDEKGNRRASMAVDGRGESFLTLRDENGQTRASMGRAGGRSGTKPV